MILLDNRRNCLFSSFSVQAQPLLCAEDLAYVVSFNRRPGEVEQPAPSHQQVSCKAKAYIPHSPQCRGRRLSLQDFSQSKNRALP